MNKTDNSLQERKKREELLRTKYKSSSKKQQQPSYSLPEWRRFLLFFFALIYIEMIARMKMSDDFFDMGIVLICVLCIPKVLLLHFITDIKGNLGKFLGAIFLGAYAFFASAQIVYFQIFQMPFSLYSAAYGSQVNEFWIEIFTAIGQNMHYLLLLWVPCIIYTVICAKRTQFKVSVKPVFTFATYLVTAAVCFGFFLSATTEPNSNTASYLGQVNLSTSAQRIGVIDTMQLDALRLFVPISDDIVLAEETDDLDSLGLSGVSDPPSAQDGISAGEPGGISQGGVSSGIVSPGATAETPKDYGYNELDIDFAARAAKGKDSTIKSLDKYFSKVQPTKKNDHTGIYEGYNLVFLTCEAFSPYALDEKLTPTLWKMANQGYQFTNYYHPSWEVSTSDGEYANVMSLIPKSGVWSHKVSSKNYLPYALGNLLKPQGYLTNAYHPHTYTYYARDLSYPNMGYTYKAKGHGLDVESTWPESDLEAMQKSVDDYIGKPPFHVYMMTVSGHMQYTFDGNYMSYKNRDLVADLPYSEGPKAYIASQIELDRAMEYLLKRLEEAGQAEKTLIVMAPDHYPYGLKDKQISEFLGHKVEPLFEQHKSTLIMYVPGMEPQTVDKLCCSLDILPTVLNLMGQDYDSRILMGQDIFSDASPLVVFDDHSFITDKGRYNRSEDEFTPNEGVTVPEGYLKSMRSIVNAKFSASTKILDSDYYRDLFQK